MPITLFSRDGIGQATAPVPAIGTEAVEMIENYEQPPQQPQPGPEHELQHPQVPMIPPHGRTPDFHGSHDEYMPVPLRE
jgi:hypothetical protein